MGMSNQAAGGYKGDVCSSAHHTHDTRHPQCVRAAIWIAYATQGVTVSECYAGLSYVPRCPHETCAVGAVVVCARHVAGTVLAA